MFSAQVIACCYIVHQVAQQAISCNEMVRSTHLLETHGLALVPAAASLSKLVLFLLGSHDLAQSSAAALGAEQGTNSGQERSSWSQRQQVLGQAEGAQPSGLLGQPLVSIMFELLRLSTCRHVQLSGVSICYLSLPHVQVQPERNVLLQAPQPLPAGPPHAPLQRGRQSELTQQERQVPMQGSASSNSWQGVRLPQHPTQVGVLVLISPGEPFELECLRCSMAFDLPECARTGVHRLSQSASV